jgi:prolyl 4-hydroxylase
MDFLAMIHSGHGPHGWNSSTNCPGLPTSHGLLDDGTSAGAHIVVPRYPNRAERNIWGKVRAGAPLGGPDSPWIRPQGCHKISCGKRSSNHFRNNPLAKLLSDYVKAYENTLSLQRCQALIDDFEASTALHERKQADHFYNFVELNVSRHWKNVEAEIARIFLIGIRQYCQSLAIGPQWPAKPMAEEIRIQRYLPDGQESFPPHVDVMDDVDARRFITAILYLNDPKGGETIFPGLDLRITPAPGRLALFPPLWLFPHAGLPPRDKPKYILHSYLLYPQRDVQAT